MKHDCPYHERIRDDLSPVLGGPLLGEGAPQDIEHPLYRQKLEREVPGLKESLKTLYQEAHVASTRDPNEDDTLWDHLSRE